MKKLSQGFIEDYFKSQSCELLDIYINCMTKVKYRCSCGNISYVRFNDFKKNKRCGCKIKISAEKRRGYTIEQLKILFNKRGCILLETEYKNNKYPMRYLCQCGDEYTINLSSFLSNGLCKKCGNKTKGRKYTSYTTKKVEELFIEKGCKLLGEYINYNSPIKYQCVCGQISNISLNKFLRGGSCKNCGRQKSSKNKRKYTIEQIKDIFKKNNCKLLEEQYINYNKLMRYQCVCGEEAKISFYNFLIGKRCKKCGHEKCRKPWAKLNIKISKQCRHAIEKILKSNNTKKTTKTKELLGYGVEELRNHIISHPNWQKVKDTKWHLDHIFPIKAFVEHNILDIKIINSLDNLQPLKAIDNLKKSDKYSKKLFKIWLKSKGKIL